LGAASAQCKQTCLPAKKSANGRLARSTNISDAEKAKNLEIKTKEEINSLLHKETSRSTNKIIFHLKEWILKQVKGPKVTYKEFRYFQFARILFLKTCPNTDIPQTILTNFFQLFRFLIHETASVRPDLYSSNTDETVHGNIIEALDTCMDSVEPMKFEYEDSCRQQVRVTEYRK